MSTASFGVLSQNTGFYPSLDRIVETMLRPLNLGPGGRSYNEPISRLQCWGTKTKLSIGLISQNNYSLCLYMQEMKHKYWWDAKKWKQQESKETLYQCHQSWLYSMVVQQDPWIITWNWLNFLPDFEAQSGSNFSKFRPQLGWFSVGVQCGSSKLGWGFGGVQQVAKIAKNSDSLSY